MKQGRFLSALSACRKSLLFYKVVRILYPYPQTPSPREGLSVGLPPSPRLGLRPKPHFLITIEFFRQSDRADFYLPCFVYNSTLQSVCLAGCCYMCLLLLKLEVVNATLEQKLFLVAVDIHAGVRADTLCVTHLTEYTTIGRDDTLDSTH